MSSETQITPDCHFTYCWNLWTGSLNFTSLSSVAMSCLPTRTPWFQRGDRLRLFYIKYVCVRTMQQTFSCNICVTRLDVTWCLIMPSQFLLSIPTPFFASYHLNCNISIISVLVKIVSVTGPGTINRFLMFLNSWITRLQERRIKDLWSSLLSGVGELWDAQQLDICVRVFTQEQLLLN